VTITLLSIVITTRIKLEANMLKLEGVLKKTNEPVN